MSLDITCLMQYDLSSGALQSPIVALLIVSLIYGFLLFCSSASTGSTSSDSSATSRNSADSVKRRGVDQNDQASPKYFHSLSTFNVPPQQINLQPSV